jgi:hypothetical protein
MSKLGDHVPGAIFGRRRRGVDLRIQLQAVMYVTGLADSPAGRPGGTYPLAPGQDLRCAPDAHRQHPERVEYVQALRTQTGHAVRQGAVNDQVKAVGRPGRDGTVEGQDDRGMILMAALSA